MSDYVNWFYSRDDDSTDEEDEIDEYAQQYLYSARDTSLARADGGDDDDNYEMEGEDGDEEATSSSSIIPVQQQSKNKNKKKKKKKKKSKANRNEEEDSLIKVVNPDEDEFLLRMRQEEIERLQQQIENTRKNAQSLNMIKFVASFSQCFKMSITHVPPPRRDNQEGIDLRRYNSVSCSSGNDVFILGGRNERYAFNDIIVYNAESNKWRSVELVNQNNRHGVFGGTLLTCIGEDLVLYTTSLNFICYRKPTSESYWYPIPVTVDTKFEQMQEISRHKLMNHKAAMVNGCMYVFGGTQDSGVSCNILQQFSFRRTAQRKARSNEMEVVMTVHKEYIYPPRNKYTIPPPRSKHGCVAVNSDLYVFGGLFESTGRLHHSNDVNKIVYNDMHKYNTATNTWSEVEVTGLQPPPLYDFSMIHIANYIYVYGGFDAKDNVQSNLYRFDLKTQSWSVIIIRGPSWPLSSSPTEYQWPCAAHCTTDIHQTKMIVVGGVHDSASQRKAVHPDHCMIFNEATDEGTTNHLTQHLWSCMIHNEHSDLHLRCADRNTGETVYFTVHRCILAVRSSYFDQLLETFEPEEWREDGTPVLEIVDFYADTVEAFLGFLYKAELNVVGAKEVQDIIRCGEQWGHYDTIEAICNGRARYLDLSAKVMTQLTHDFEKLFNEGLEEFDEESTPDFFGFDALQEKSSEGIKKYADACIHLLSDDDEVVLKLTGHKIFLCRAPHIHNAFNSGMEESQTGNIQFNGLGRDGLYGVLRFLYTDELDVTPSISLEVLLASHMFILPILTSYCRMLVMENVNKENVLQILDIADTYHLSELKRTCLSFFMKHFEELRKEEAFSWLSDELRQNVENHLIPRHIQQEYRKKRREYLRTQQQHRKKNEKLLKGYTRHFAM